MGSFRRPGPLSRKNHPPVNDGTLHRSATPKPGTVGHVRKHGKKRRHPAHAAGAMIGAVAGRAASVPPSSGPAPAPAKTPAKTPGQSPQAQTTNIYVIEKTTGLARPLSLAEAQTLYRGGDLQARVQSKNFYFLRGGAFVPTSQATIDRINDSAKCVPIVGFAVRKLQADARSFGGKFPEGYYRTFAVAVFEAALSLSPADPDRAIDLVGDRFGREVAKTPDTLPAYHIFEAIARVNDDNGFDKVQHFVRSAQLQYNWGGTVTDVHQYVKEIFYDEIPSWFDPHETGFDPNDMRANNQGQAYGARLYEKYHPVRQYFINMLSD